MEDNFPLPLSHINIEKLLSVWFLLISYHKMSKISNIHVYVPDC